MKRLLTVIVLLLTVMAQLKAEGLKINVAVGDRTFTATIADTETGRAFYDLLPMTLDMNELNGNEKYCYLDSPLPTDTYRPGTINAGDILLYGSSCVVLFYETFQSSYSYTRIGALDNPEGIAQALGGGNVSVTFDKASSAVTGIRAVNDSPSVVAVYDLKGTAMASDTSSLPHGIYIVKYSDGKTRKVIQ